ncbi:uncharacterized protein LOC124155031 [Ischnura elegans]|uniref:uncharacterized protein LOC124155031 n=1 Tax=Ischnura elegans TaxID=197161 RepID=UPI001ED89610|nr:uncharacterized protein LOC124155031 [Ischnura elegans]
MKILLLFFAVVAISEVSGGIDLEINLEKSLQSELSDAGDDSTLKSNSYRPSPRHFHHLHKLLHHYLLKKLPLPVHSSGHHFGGSFAQSNGASSTFSGNKVTGLYHTSFSSSVAQSGTVSAAGKGNQQDHQDTQGSIATGSALSKQTSKGLVGEAGDHRKYSGDAFFSKGAAIAVSSSGNIASMNDRFDKYANQKHQSEGLIDTRSPLKALDDQGKH